MEQAHAFLTHFSGPAGYLFFFSLVAACGIGFPFNSDITLIAAAVLCATGAFHLWILMILAFLGLLSGDTICFFVARRWGRKLLSKRPFLWILPEKKVNHAEAYLNHHGRRLLFLVRFLPLIRTALFFSAGTLQVRPRTFYLMTVSATLIYVPALMLSSYFAAANIDGVIATLKQIQFGLLGACLVAAAIWIYRNHYSKKATVDTARPCADRENH